MTTSTATNIIDMDNDNVATTNADHYRNQLCNAASGPHVDHTHIVRMYVPPHSRTSSLYNILVVEVSSCP